MGCILNKMDMDMDVESNTKSDSEQMKPDFDGKESKIEIDDQVQPGSDMQSGSEVKEASENNLNFPIHVPIHTVHVAPLNPFVRDFLAAFAATSNLSIYIKSYALVS